jgi:NADPH-dependent 2,4-dienoyl-CoA reductase/sulfur reductase-like enzyme
VLGEVTLTDGTSSRSLQCDVLCAAFGLLPNVELARLLGCTIESGATLVNGEQATDIPDVYCCGETTGVGGVEMALVEGEIAGLASTGRRVPPELASRRARLGCDAAELDRTFALRRELFALGNPETVVCRCEDVRLGELDERWSARQAKLFTRAGMGPCQGRVCGPALECLMGWPPDVVRLPVQPARVSTLVGQPLANQQLGEQGAH